MKREIVALIGVAAVGAVLAAASASAQTAQGGQAGQPEPPGRPYRTLFGPSEGRRSLHELDLNLSFDGAVDNGLLVPNASASGFESRRQQMYTAGANLAYTRRGERVGANASASCTLPYYSMYRDEPLTLAYGGDAGISYVSRATSASATGSYLRSPYSALGLDLGAPPSASGGVGGDYAFARIPNERVAATASASRRLGRETSLAVAYAYDDTRFLDEDRSMRSQGPVVSMEHRLSRSLSVRGGYGYRDTSYLASAGAEPTRRQSQDVDIGLGYVGRSRGRPPTFTVSAGVSVIDDAARRYSLWRGSVEAGRPIGRDWFVAAGFTRALQFPGALQEPIWGNTATASATGYVGRRVELTMGATYTNGNRITSRGRGFDTYLGDARARIGLTRSLAMEAGYTYYRYAYPADFDLPAGMPHRLNRHRLMVGASVWLPVLRAGRAGAARALTNR